MTDAGPPSPPAPPPGWAPPPAGPPAGQFYSLRGLTTALTVLLWIAAAAGVFGVVAFANRISFESDLIDNGFPDSIFELSDLVDRGETADGIVDAAVLLIVLLSLTILVLIIIWTWRAMKNNEMLDRDRRRFTSG